MLFLPLCSVFAFASVNALRVSNIEECPALTPRSYRPDNVNDVRPDDIKAVAGLGDSFMTAARMYKMNSRLLPTSLMQYQGSSFAMGGDEDAKSLPKFLERYNSDIKGASIGERVSSHCEKNGCGLVPGVLPYFPSLDNLNAAINGATAADLNTEIDYLIESLKRTPGVDFANDWKLITVKLGGNDQCNICGTDRPEDSTVEKFGSYFQAAIERIHQSIPRAIVNLMGSTSMVQMFEVINGQEYCKHDMVDIADLLFPSACACFQGDAVNRTLMDNASQGYNQKLIEIYENYKTIADPNFGVTFTPANLEFPISLLEIAISNTDCVHPTMMGQQWLAKRLWNDLFIPVSSKEKSWTFVENETIYCPTEDDRFRMD